MTVTLSSRANAGADNGTRSAGSFRKRKHDFLPYVLIAPAAIVVVSFTIFALAFTGVISFTNWDIVRPGISFVGLANYIKAAADTQLMTALEHSAVFVLSVVALSSIAGFIFALALNRRFRGRGAMRALVVLPWVISEFASGTFWALLLTPHGPLASLLGLGDGPLTTSSGAMISLILVETWRSIGFVTVMVLAGLQQIEPQLYEAARLDGAGPTRMSWSITLPLVSPTLLVSAILLTIGNFNLVTMIIALTGGGPITATQTTALYMYTQTFTYFHLGYGAAIALIMTVLNVVVMGAFILLQRGKGARS